MTFVTHKSRFLAPRLASTRAAGVSWLSIMPVSASPKPMGRPPVAVEKKRKSKIQVYVTDDDNERIDRVRGDITRSDWGLRAFRKQLAREERQLLGGPRKPVGRK